MGYWQDQVARWKDPSFTGEPPLSDEQAIRQVVYCAISDFLDVQPGRAIDLFATDDEADAAMESFLQAQEAVVPA